MVVLVSSNAAHEAEAIGYERRRRLRRVAKRLPFAAPLGQLQYALRLAHRFNNPAPLSRPPDSEMPFASQLTLKLLLCGTLFACMSGFAHADLKPDLRTFEQQVKPLLQKYCVQCHGSEKPEGKMRFDTIDPDSITITGEHFGKWEDAREAFNTGEMPPEGELQPAADERDVITRWLDAEFNKAKQYGTPNKRGR